MKSGIIRDYETDIDIAYIHPPELKNDSVLIAAHTASLNPIDYILQPGTLKEMILMEFPHTKGFDVSGVIDEVGKDVAGSKVGDAVFARANQQDAGAIAQTACLKATEMAQKPANIRAWRTYQIGCGQSGD